jgi:hypothetical protein
MTMTDIGIFKLSCTIIFDAMVVISEIVSVFLTVFCAAIMLHLAAGTLGISWDISGYSALQLTDIAEL